MRSTLLFGVLLFGIFAHSIAGPATCKNGDHKKDDDNCNDCVCSGGRWACTLKFCYNPNSNQHIQVKRDVECQDGDRKKDADGCNDCFCNGGHWACTLMLCPGENQHIQLKREAQHIQVKREAPECEDGQTSRKECNTCKCAQGMWFCTRKTCIYKRDIGQECQEGETKQMDCNRCACAKGRFVCTRRLCFKQMPAKRDIHTKALNDLKNVPCSPSDTFDLDCNTCQCNFERTGYTCVQTPNCTLTT